MENGIFDNLDFNPLISVETDEEEAALAAVAPEVKTKEEEEEEEKPSETKDEFIIEVEEDETPDNTPINRQDEQNTDNDSVKQWAAVYKEKGMLPEEVDTEEIQDFDDLLEKLQEQQLLASQALVESYKNSLPDKIKQLVETWEEGAEEEAFNKVLATKKEQVKLEKLDEDSIKGNIDTQKAILKTYLLKTTKLTEEKIDKHISRLESIEELEEEALTTAKELKDLLQNEEQEIKEKVKQNQIKRAEQAIKQKENLKSTISKTKAIIGDIQVTDGEKKEIENYLFNPVAKDQNGNPIFYIQKLMLDNPEEMTVKLNYLAVVTKGFTDWSKITKKAETKAAKKIDTTFNPPPKQISNKKQTGSGDWRDNLKGFKY